MKDLPNPFWALCFMGLATVLAICALFRPSVPTVTIAVITLASNIASGAFGYINGHKDGAASVIDKPPAPPAA